MSIATHSALNRRKLAFASFADVLADAEQLAAAPKVQVLGNWPFERLLMHIALGIDKSIDGITFRVPWYMRVVGFFIKGRVINRGMPHGFKLPKETEASAYPMAASPQEALAVLRKAVARTRVETMGAHHPVFGRMTHEEWARFHLRHAELHLSFVIPG
jgi:hypothetical protein